MPYTLYLGNRAYSSWSLRGWLLLKSFGIPFDERIAMMQTPDFDAMRADMAPARLVPTLKTPDGVVWELQAIAEYLAETHPDAGIWPSDKAARAAARALAGEMHSGFGALRRECPMNLRRRYPDRALSDEARADIARMTGLWAWARDRFGGPWLGGDRFTAVDAFYAPAATRLHTYGVALDAEAQDYVDRIRAHPDVVAWIKAGMREDVVEVAGRDYEFGTIRADTPNPTGPVEVYTGDVADCVNFACPNSGKPVVAEGLCRMGGAVLGFCNAGCRNDFVADPAAYPHALRLLAGRARG